MSTRANFYVDMGVDFTVDVELTTTGDTAMSLVGKTFKGEARKVYSSAKSFDLTLSTIEGSGGTPSVLEIEVPKEATANLQAGKYYYDVLMTDTSSGNVSKIMEGIIFLTPTMTDVVT